MFVYLILFTITDGPAARGNRGRGRGKVPEQRQTRPRAQQVKESSPPVAEVEPTMMLTQPKLAPSRSHVVGPNGDGTASNNKDKLDNDSTIASTTEARSEDDKGLNKAPESDPDKVLGKELDEKEFVKLVEKLLIEFYILKLRCLFMMQYLPRLYILFNILCYYMYVLTVFVSHFYSYLRRRISLII